MREFTRAPHVLLVAKTRQGTGLRNAICIERLACLLEHFGDPFRSQTIANAQVGEALDFRECSHHHDIAILAHIPQDIRWIIKKLKIRFVKNHQHMLGHPLHETVYRLLPDECAGRVIGVCDEKLTRAGSDGSQHGIQIMRVAGIRNSDRRCTKKLRHEAVNRKGVTGRHDFVARFQKCVTDELDDFVRAIPKNDILPLEV